MNQSRSIFKQLKHLSFVRRLAIGLFDNGIYNIKRKLPGCDMDLVNYQSPGLYFSAYNQDGFILNSGVKVIGSCAAFPRNAFSWNVNNALDISEESLSLFFILEPPLEVLIIGKGETKVPVDRRRILDICWKHHLPVEVMSTHHAIGTFNFLNSEGRYVAAAIIPPRRLDAYDEADREAKKLLLGRESEEYSKTYLLNSNTPKLLKSSDFKGDIIVSRSPLVTCNPPSPASLPSGSNKET
ncbi:NADH dehydrogenase [ubiquinone] 1 alpha subcomplex assembly factor 3 [Schistosoma japonicum]|uniref:NADH dehydrogenase [ubiquinone] 1 alpha subcomplex assembly factor 3 n=1 Tax=Schistosoma japonicum TaxID=6182 RepID=A0A4Z2D587_SCHJA|nr:NADH dehydrogenase [ubiquinone] 1 alpha subcomplex assembly factor 3 [Schistosoma japonicum]KAH8860397.1 NADH dehydrogenase [ubiquinone] 1 alpha subcomplex assembly factor 3 [Schistosoma japonicum]TNN11644.1 NADH dehydrogenase [ubiquinone] 1 alpha subcomplex assembly factor 3 [Schistosoma japonicum]